MSLTTKERVEREKQRRDAANERMREKVAAARRRGGKLDQKPGTRRNYSTFPDCREKAVASATRYYREGPLPPRVRPRAKLDVRLRDSTGVRRRLALDWVETQAGNKRGQGRWLRIEIRLEARGVILSETNT